MQGSPRLYKKVYDILDCGPRHCFVVRGRSGHVLLAHNCTQATARDAFGEGILRLEKAGVPVLWHVHDEVICEIDPDVTQERVCSLLAQPPSWMPDLPVEAEAEISNHYKK